MPGLHWSWRKAGLMILADLVGAAAFHGSENADHSLAPAAFDEPFLDEGLLALSGVDLDDGDVFGGGALADMVGDGEAELVGVGFGAVDQADTPEVQQRLHRRRIGDRAVGAE